ncbi:MAG: A/G-specific adenine glycosylase [Patescibacteria group bacterium]|jgi:A/G-specific adenine glycosylase
MKKLTSKQIRKFQERVITWYTKNQVSLPWRQTTDPYKILISEVMLQQTQVERVRNYYARWLQKYPTITSLAKSDKRELLQLWSGLGYNSRVLRLQKLAQQITEDKKYKGKLPKGREALLELPGIGPYISAAVMAFAHNQLSPVVDTNIRRILIDEFNLPHETKEKDLEELALMVTPEGKAREWNNALMDYGRLHKTARKTKISPITKQSKFEGSTRQVRSNIVKSLLEKEPQIKELLKKKFPHPEFDKIVDKMLKEEIITISMEQIKLAN